MLKKLHSYFKKQDQRYVVRYDKDFLVMYKNYQNYTMTSKERMNALYESIVYIKKNNLDGDFVECGVWRGGSSLLMFDMLQKRKLNNKLFLYDTFEGMTQPTTLDVDMAGNVAEDLLNKKEKYPNVYAYSSLEEVKSNFQTFFDKIDSCQFIKGDVLQTIPNHMPDKISLLRLDTDWYKSTYHELKHLYPKVVSGGVIIIDDYGHWKGSKKATDQYFQEINYHPYLHRIDYSGRLIIKP